MRTNPFLSKEVKCKRVWTGFAVGLPLVIMIVVIGSYYTNLIKEYLREKYQTEKIVYVESDDVLGCEDNIDFSNSEDIQTDYTKWLYNEADSIVESYDISDREIIPIVQLPEIGFSQDQNSVKKDYSLTTADTIGLECFKIDTTASQLYDISYCDVSLNGEKTERITAWGWTDNKSIEAHITIFDDEKLYSPLIVVAQSFRSGSRDDLSVYRIEESKLKGLKFSSNEELNETWFSNPYSKLFIENNDEFLVTYFHDPAMIEKSLTRVWKMGNISVDLTQTILERDLLDLD